MEEEISEQMELFPRASLTERIRSKKLLKEFRKAKQMVQLFEGEVKDLTPEQAALLTKCKANVWIIEKAIELIFDEDVRKIIKHRFVKGQSYSETVRYFAYMSDRTIERKLNEGIASIANTLKMWTG